jgi:hypothetical protein
MAVVRWTFDDPVNLDSYTFDVNPNEGGSPALQKAFQYSNTSAPDGKTVVFEGRDQVQKIEFSGVILEESHYTAFETWWNHRNQILLTDDLGRQFYIVIESFSPTRKRSALHPWKHEYKISATVVDYP